MSRACADASAHGFASVCIPPFHVPLASSLMSGTTGRVCTVVSFPNGYCSTRTKAHEASCLVSDGADEVDMVCNVPLLRRVASAPTGEDVNLWCEDVLAVCEAAGEAGVKCIIEAGALTDFEVATASLLFREARHRSAARGCKPPEFIKTSTGFNGYGGATVKDVSIMAFCVRESGGKVKASGGVGSGEQARRIVEAGAERIGASKGVKIVTGDGGAGGGGGY